MGEMTNRQAAEILTDIKSFAVGPANDSRIGAGGRKPARSVLVMRMRGGVCRRITSTTASTAQRDITMGTAKARLIRKLPSTPR